MLEENFAIVFVEVVPPVPDHSANRMIHGCPSTWNPGLLLLRIGGVSRFLEQIRYGNLEVALSPINGFEGRCLTRR